MTALIRAGVPQIIPEANAGRWVARCPRCPSALAMNPLDSLFECWECGQAAEIVWPDEAVVYGVERLLLMRPDPTTRNWTPGETLQDLMIENAAHGIFDTLDTLELPSRHLFIVDDREIRTDLLPVPPRRFPKAIGA